MSMDWTVTISTSESEKMCVAWEVLIAEVVLDLTDDGICSFMWLLLGVWVVPSGDDRHGRVGG